MVEGGKYLLLPCSHLQSYIQSQSPNSKVVNFLELPSFHHAASITKYVIILYENYVFSQVFGVNPQYYTISLVNKEIY